MNNRINIGDYIQGLEHLSIDGEATPRTKIMRGWVMEIHDERVTIKADDSFGGARGTDINVNTCFRVNRVPDWQYAINRKIADGTIVKHFKGNLYKIITCAENVDGPKMVIYQALYSPFKVYAREYAEFMSEVDHIKYPKTQQKYRFEIVKDLEV